ncbi:MAG: class I SAM-dependent methyltransferase [Alphaproteobacteria bacterium]
MKDCQVGDLPIWLGTQPNANLETAPFGFTIGDHGLVRMANQDIVARMVSAYSVEGYHFITSPPGASDWGNELARKSIQGLIDTYGSIEGKRILEVGGGTLYSAETMISEFGAESVLLVDPAVVDEPSTDKITVIRDYFGADTPIDRPIDVIVSFNTLEHVPEPVAFLQAMSDRLAPEASLYLKLPECRQSLAIGDLGLCVHEHLSYFTPASLDACLEVVGLKRVAEANYKGALQVLAKKADPNPAARADESEALLDGFDRNYRRHLDRLKSLIAEKGWRKVAFVGCSVGLCNTLNLSGLTDTVEIGLFDNDDLKKGQFLPGIDRPIDVPNRQALLGYDAIFITPVNFFDPISDGLKKLLGDDAPTILPVFEEE